MNRADTNIIRCKYFHRGKFRGRIYQEKEERTTENKMERREYWTESGRGDGQGDMEKEDNQTYRRSYDRKSQRKEGDVNTFMLLLAR